MKTLAGGGELRCIPDIKMSKTLIYCIQPKNSQCKKMLKKESQKTVEIESRNVVETDTTSLCLLNKPTYRQHFRGRRSFNYAKRFSVFNQEIFQCDPHSNRPIWALRPPFYLASSLHPPHKPSILTFDALRKVKSWGSKTHFFFPSKVFWAQFLTFNPIGNPKSRKVKS